MATPSDSINTFSLQSQNRTSRKTSPGPLKSVLEKALDEVARGDPEEGERLIELALLEDADTGLLISQMLEALKAIVIAADENPFAAIGNVIEHGLGSGIRTLIAKAIGGAHG